MRLTALGLVGLAVGCTSPQDIETARQSTVAGGAFDQALYTGYLALAESETAQADWIDADFYFGKAQAVLRGEAVAPELVADWNVPDDAVADIAAGREALVDVLNRGGAEFAPADSAEAQTAFDCWMEQQEEAFQTDDIDGCRSAFDAALARAKAATGGVVAMLLPSDGAQQTAIEFATDAGAAVIDQPLTATQAQADAAPPQPPVPLKPTTVETLFGDAIAAQPDDPVDTILYFLPGTATLTDESAAQVDGIVAFALGRPVVSVRVVGHTDTVGSPAVNARLSLRRAIQVRDTLVGAGLPEASIDVFSLGESNPLVPTPDETDEPRNRRVVVTVR
ncbi:MAG: OmpA family protein [Alphaproteobacteria bacterium]